MVYNFIEVCAGAGGMSQGFMNAGMKPLLLLDNDKDSCRTLKVNHPDVNVQCIGMETIDVSEYTDKVDVLCGGIPCQSWSQAGRREGVNDSRGHLVYTFRDLVKTIKPKMFVIENVKGMTTLNKGEAFREILDILKCDNCYDIKHKVLNANDYGVAQKRERLFIVGKYNRIIQSEMDDDIPIGTLLENNKLRSEYNFPDEMDYKPGIETNKSLNKENLINWKCKHYDMCAEKDMHAHKLTELEKMHKKETENSTQALQSLQKQKKDPLVHPMNCHSNQKYMALHLH